MNLLNEILQNPKTIAQLTVTTTTTGAGGLTAKAFSFTDPGFIIAVVGLICTGIVTFFAWQRNKREKEVHEFEMRRLEHDEKRRQEIIARQNEGLPTRRVDDKIVTDNS